MSQGPLERYKTRVASGEMDEDAAQLEVAARLDQLAQLLQSWRPARSWSLGSLLNGRKPAPRGLYIHGKVGRGKTMLMDLFYDASDFVPKRRVHFHEFMVETHDRIAAARKGIEGDPIRKVAAAIAADCQLLCFDEFHVTDIADAMILGRLFTGLFEHQVVTVATSNVPPSGLYRNGLNRQLFLPFIDLLQSKMDVLELVAAKDFRLEKLDDHPLYFTPLDEASRRALSATFTRLTGLWSGKPASLDVRGRTLRIGQAARGVARFTFTELCEQPLGTLDYLELARAFHTVLIEDVPILARERRAAARRFINLVDTLYDAHVGLVVSAEAEPHALHPQGDEAFLFERTASRLIEMRSAEYLAGRMARIDKDRPDDSPD